MSDFRLREMSVLLVIDWRVLPTIEDRGNRIIDLSQRIFMTDFHAGLYFKRYFQCLSTVSRESFALCIVT
jgi:hypothetical protein